MAPRVIDIDHEVIASVLEQYPVRLAVLFGSHAQERATPESDVDIAVAFAREMSAKERLEHRIELLADLVDALGTDNVDVADLDCIKPAVGYAALTDGIVLVGTPSVADAYRTRFEQTDQRRDETHEERMARFDAILERLEDIA